jgi:hypothetical protein
MALKVVDLHGVRDYLTVRLRNYRDKALQLPPRSLDDFFFAGKFRFWC